MFNRHSAYVKLYNCPMDTSTAAFVSATGLTGTTEINAINNLVKRLKGYGLWSKMKAIYPFVSDTVNLLSYTEDLSNGTWQKTQTTISANATTDPNGNLTADKLIENTTNNNHNVFQQATLGNVQMTFSVYLKKAERSYCYVNMSDLTTGDASTKVDLNTGTLSSTGISQGSWTNMSSTITNVGNGWYRVTLTATKGSGTISQPYITLLNNSQATPYLGDGTSGLYIWGAQLELSSSASTYQPIATTTASRFVSQFKYNLKDPRDLDAAFRLSFNGTWTYSKQGATPNGVNGYADTYLTPSTTLSLNSTHLSYYSRTNNSTNGVEMGSIVTAGAGLYLLYSYSGVSYKALNRPQTSTGSVFTPTNGLLIGNRQSSTTEKYYHKGTLIDTLTVSTTALPPNKIFLAAYNNGAVANEFSTKQVAFSTVGDGLTDTEATNLYTSVQLFQQELSRYVGVPIVSDANAQAFLDAAVITDQTQANAVNTLVTDLKTYGLWTKMKAIYPFVGGTATTHKWNLKDPRDLDAAYRLAFSGAWTHSSTGALPNGANAFADTKFIPNTALTLNSAHLSFYSRTNNTTGIDDFSSVIVGDTQNMRMIINLSGSFYADLNSTTQRITVANANSLGFYQVSRASSTSLKVYKNATILGTNTSANTGTQPTISMYLSAANRAGGTVNYSNRECAFASLGDGLNDSEASSLYTLVQAFQTSLSRQV